MDPSLPHRSPSTSRRNRGRHHRDGEEGVEMVPSFWRDQSNPHLKKKYSHEGWTQPTFIFIQIWVHLGWSHPNPLPPSIKTIHLSYLALGDKQVG